MKRAEAVALLRAYQADEVYIFDPREYNKSYEGKKAFYQIFIVEELIRRICESDKDPVEVIKMFHAMVDDVLCNTEGFHPYLYADASLMENVTYEILLYIGKKQMGGGKRD